MKKCPNCQKEFPDNMRFCQTDGTPLVESAAEEDPLKTTVVRQEDFASSIPQPDPYKTTVGSSQAGEDSGDLLQLPEENFDPMKTMVVAPLGQNKSSDEPKGDSPRFEDIKEEIKSESSSSPFSGFSQPSDPLPEAPKDISAEPTIAQPEPPKFNEPSLSPPSFGDMSASKQEEEDLPQTVMQNPWDSAPKADSPFSKPTDAPMSSPFDPPKSSSDEPKSSFDAPPSPFGQPSSPFDAPQSSYDQPKSSFDPPQASFENQPSSFDPPKPSFQEPPANQFGSQFDQMNQGFGGNQPLQQSEWTPPSPPEQSWGDQGLGANTPFQPPVAGAGQNQTMAIISLVTGILSCLCCFSVITGPVAIVLGVMAKNKINAEPNLYTGAGLATGGIVTGAIGTLIGIAAVVLQLLGAFAGRF